jgi:hypothetical protein
MHETLKSKMDDAHQLVSLVAESAIVLQSTVAQTHAKVQDMGSFTALGGSFLKWIALALVIAGFAMINRKVAAIVAILSGNAVTHVLLYNS